MEVNGVPIIEPTAGSATGSTTLAQDFDTFLTLLTTQLQHQDPLEPLDTTEFTNQLTSFAQVEQAINSNAKLDRLIDLQGANQLTTGVDYIGQFAEASSDAMLLQNGQGRIGYELNTDSARTSITILNQNGTPVLTVAGSTNAGRHIFDWDGLDNVGNQLQDGVYTALVTALDAEDNVLETSTTSFGKVTGVELVDGKVTLVMGGVSVDLEDVLSIQLDESETQST